LSAVCTMKRRPGCCAIKAWAVVVDLDPTCSHNTSAREWATTGKGRDLLAPRSHRPSWSSQAG
jgi:hypothetical protein